MSTVKSKGFPVSAASTSTSMRSFWATAVTSMLVRTEIWSSPPPAVTVGLLAWVVKTVTPFKFTSTIVLPVRPAVLRYRVIRSMTQAAGAIHAPSMVATVDIKPSPTKRAAESIPP